MNVLSKIIDFGKSPELTAREERLLKLSNVTFIVILCFILANLFSFLSFGNKKDIHLIIVFAFHFVLISASLILNLKKKYLIAKINFSIVAIIFVSYYSIAYGKEGFNYLFIPMIIFLIFNLFEAKEKLIMWILILFASLTYFVALYANYNRIEYYINIEKSFRLMQGIVSLIGYLSLTIMFGFYNFKLTIKTENKLLAEKVAIDAQKIIIENAHKEITDSINYAKRLQHAIFPPTDFITTNFPESFILYKPKDIVAGDFYWAEKIEDLFFITAADCTGHGVPGAMVSVVCSIALNRTVNEFGVTDTGKILDKTRELVIDTFTKSNTEVKDGMDISLLCIDKQNQKIFWSGANNPLWYIHDNELKEIKADKQPIGKTDNPKPFTTHQLKYKENTTFYLFTDGLADQFGGPKGKKFKYKQFGELLIEINNKAMQEQSTIINEKFETWKNELEQVDDVCVIGIKI
jgi:serine phosphatase RsbU (regulator of sigma subunit)